MTLGISLNNGTGASASASMGAYNPVTDREAIIRIITASSPPDDTTTPPPPPPPEEDPKPIPEPLTILGSVAALGFGAYAERKRKTSNPSEEDNTKDS